MAEPTGTIKPQCGGRGSDAADYDLGLHVAALFLVLLFSIGGAGFPVVAKRVKAMKIPPNIFFACKHFGTGVLIATAFVHLIPTAFQSLNDPCLPDFFTVKYPAMPGVIMMVSLLALFTIEVVLKAKTGGHSHSGPTIAGLAGHDAPTEVSTQIQYSNQTDDIERGTVGDKGVGSAGRYDADDLSPPTRLPYPNPNQIVKTAIEEPEIDKAKFKKMSLNIALLEGGILFHSIFVGMTVSITTDGFIVLLIAILFHQFFEGLGLGSRIAAVPYKKGAATPWILVVAFGTTAPIGQAIGLIARNSYDPQSAFALILVGVFNAISSGLLIYASAINLLAEDFLTDEAQLLMTNKMKILAFIYILLGAAGMSTVGAFA